MHNCCVFDLWASNFETLSRKQSEKSCLRESAVAQVEITSKKKRIQKFFDTLVGEKNFVIRVSPKTGLQESLTR